MDEHDGQRGEEDLSEQLGDGAEIDFASLEDEAVDEAEAVERGRAAGGDAEGEAVEDDDEREDTLESVTVEITGLSLYTHHGVSDSEREVGQRLVLDLRLELGEAGATATDRIEDTVDYGEVCQLVALVAQQRSYRTLERLCSSVADRLLADYALEGVWVKAAKPEPPIPLPVDEVSVEVWREPEE
ncbi:MAG: dihydroneopterin aldolase [Solirubrobacteraceae bacterium]